MNLTLFSRGVAAHWFTTDQHATRIEFQVVVAATEDLVRAEETIAVKQEASS